MRRLIAGLLLAAPVLLSPAPSPAQKPTDKPDVTPEKLAGTWLLVKTTDKDPPEDTRIAVDFTKDGGMTIRAQVGDLDPTILKGKYTIKDGKIDYTVKRPDGGDKQEVLTVKKFTGDGLVTEDPEGIVETFNRVKPKKKFD